MTGNLESPSAAGRTGEGHRYKQALLLPSEEYCRIAAIPTKSAPWNPCDWNGTPAKALGLGPFEVGRFDPYPGDDFKFLYAAAKSRFEAVAIQETLRHKIISDPDRNRDVLYKSHLDLRQLTYFKVTEMVSLADIRTDEGRDAFGVSEEVQYSANRDITRDWGRFFRAELPRDVAGLAYSSTQETARGRAHSFVLWGDRCPSLFTITRTQLLGDSRGMQKVIKAFGGRNLLIL